MRARKRNPYLGGGLDKRQARRARRRYARQGWVWNGVFWVLVDEHLGWEPVP